MLITLLIEISGAVWTLIRYRSNRTAQLIMALLILLAVFQAAEYMVCEGAFGLSSSEWARIGYAAITFLPALGLHLGLGIANQQHKQRPLLGIAYGSAALLAGYFLFAEPGLQSQQCLGNYVIFSIGSSIAPAYIVYYYGWLLVATGMTSYYYIGMKNKDHRKALIALLMGYAAFILPTVSVNVLNPTTAAGIPSIMCGFAVILALILVLSVSPRVLTPR